MLGVAAYSASGGGGQVSTARERELEDAVLLLWGELPAEQVHQLRLECPRLMDFCVHLHHSIEHEQAMVRRNVWTEA